MENRWVRWVERRGNTVRFGNLVGAFVGQVHTYELPDHALAAEFEATVSTLDGQGNPAPVDPGRWGKFRVLW
jgi:hypothetical protein